MHGILCFLVERYVEHRHGPEAWSDAHYAAGIAPQSYGPTEDYPDETFLAVVHKLAEAQGQPLQSLLEKVGFHLAPHLLAIYATLVRPEHSTFSFLTTVEDLIHRTIRMRNPELRPPAVTCLWQTQDQMELVYSSPRKLCGLAKGLVLGVANYFQEKIALQESSCMLRGDPYCCFSLLHLNPPAATAGGGSARTSRKSLADTRWLSPSSGTGYDWLPHAREPGDLGQLAHYRLLRSLGEGGMGVVFLAEDTQLQRRVAIKVLKPAMLGEPAAEQQFVREARAAGGLCNDHVVPIYQIGEDHGLPYVVMPVLIGHTLREWLVAGEAVTLGRVMQIARESSLGLAAAHERSLVHRDIKPSNIWLESPAGRVKLMDFGLTHSAVTDSQMLHRGSIVGTFQYMAPEQADGSAVLPQSDLYSLGVVLFELCTGRLPLAHKSVLEMLRALALDSPPEVTEINAAVPYDLGLLIMQMLAKDPAQRPISARELVTRVESIRRRLDEQVPGWWNITIRSGQAADAAQI